MEEVYDTLPWLHLLIQIKQFMHCHIGVHRAFWLMIPYAYLYCCAVVGAFTGGLNPIQLPTLHLAPINHFKLFKDVCVHIF